MRRTVALLFCLFALPAAHAAPRDAVHAAFAKFLAATSFRATVVDARSGDKISELAFVAPDRYHVQSTRGPEMTLIGDDAWMNMNGHPSKVPLPVGKMVAQYRNANTLAQLDKLDVTEIGADAVGGEPAHAYHYTLTDPVRADVKLWVDDRSGLPLQIESQGSFMGHASTTRIRYSDFNDAAIRIAAPN